MKRNWSKRIEGFVNHKVRRVEVIRNEKNDLLVLYAYARKEHVLLGKGRHSC